MRRTAVPILALLLMLLTAGCNSTETVTERVAVEHESAQRTEEPDTLLKTRPDTLPAADIETNPSEVTEYRRSDTTSPAAEMTGIEATEGEMTVWFPDGAVTFDVPTSEAETLSVRPDTAGGLEAGLRGAPAAETLDVDIERDKRTWIEKASDRIHEVLAFVGFLALIAIAVRFLLR